MLIQMVLSVVTLNKKFAISALGALIMHLVLEHIRNQFQQEWNSTFQGTLKYLFEELLVCICVSFYIVLKIIKFHR